MLDTVFRLLESHDYTSADVLWFTDFIIPLCSVEQRKKISHYRRQGTKFYGLKIGRAVDKGWKSYFDEIVEVEKIVEVTKEVPTYVEVEKTTTEINGIAVTGDYATQAKTDTITLTVLYVDKTLNPDFDPTLEEGEDNPLYIANNVVATFDYAVECTYKVLIFGGATYLPTLPEEEILVRIEGFYAINGGYLYATDATHTITAAGHVDTDTIPVAAFEQAAADYEYVTFAVAD